MADVEVNGMNPYPEKEWHESKKFACHCKDFDLSKMPHLANMLPEGYDQKLCDYIQVEGDEKFILTLRLNITKKEEVTLWLQNFEEKSMTSHVLDKSTNEGAGRLYKLTYRCKLQTYRAAKRQNKDLELCCPARITVSIRNPGQRVNRRRHPHADTHPTHMRINFIHNHALDTPEFRSKRKLCPQLKERFESMFKQGMKPRDALNQHKWELQSQLGPEKYLEVALDGFYMPNMGRLCSMYKRITGTTSIKTSTKRISKNNPDADRFSYESCNFATQCSEQGDEDDDDSGESDLEDREEKSSYSMKREETLPSHSGHWNVNSGNPGPLQQDPRPGPSGLTTGGPSYDMARSQMHSEHHQQPTSAGAPVLTFQNMESLSFDSAGKGYKLDDPTGLRGAGMPSVSSHHHHHQHPMTPGTSSSRPHSQLSDPYLTGPGPNNRFPLPPAMDLRHVPNQPSHNMSHQGLQGFPQYPTSHGHAMPGFDPHAPPYFYDQNTLGRASASQPLFPHHTSGLLQQNPPVQRDDRFHTDIPVSSLYQSEHLQQADLMPQQPPQSHNKLQHPGMKSPMTDQSKPPRGQKRKSNESSDGDKKKKGQKKTPTNTYSVKRFRETLMNSTTTVQPSTQVSAQEALQNIILADKSRAIEERLSSFYSAVEQTMDMDPKLFVPALTKFLDTWNKLSGEDLANALKEFGNTKKIVIEEHKRLKYLNSKDKGTQSVRVLISKPICFSKAIQTPDIIPTTPTVDDYTLDAMTDVAETMPTVRSVRTSGVTYMYIDPGSPEDVPKRRSARKRKPKKSRKRPVRKAAPAEVNPSNSNPELRRLLDFKSYSPLLSDTLLGNVNQSIDDAGKQPISPRTTRSRENKLKESLENKESLPVPQVESPKPESSTSEANFDEIKKSPDTEAAASLTETKEETPSATSTVSPKLSSESPKPQEDVTATSKENEAENLASETRIEESAEPSPVQDSQ